MHIWWGLLQLDFHVGLYQFIDYININTTETGRYFQNMFDIVSAGIQCIIMNLARLNREYLSPRYRVLVILHIDNNRYCCLETDIIFCVFQIIRQTTWTGETFSPGPEGKHLGEEVLYVGHLLFCIHNHLFSPAPGGDEELRKSFEIDQRHERSILKRGLGFLESGM